MDSAAALGRRVAVGVVGAVALLAPPGLGGLATFTGACGRGGIAGATPPGPAVPAAGERAVPSPPRPGGLYVAMFGGDARHTGRTATRGPHAEPRILWRVRTQRRVFASPAVTSQGWAVFGSLDGSVHAVDLTGVERWAYVAGDRVVSSPALVGELTVVGHDGDAFVGLGPRGALRWTAPQGEDADSPPVVGPDGTVYVASHGVSALGPDGQVRWTARLAGHVFGAPALGIAGELFVPELAGGVTVLNAQDGRLLRRIALPAPLHGGALVLDDGSIVVGTEDGHVRAFAQDGGARWDFATQGATHGRGVRSTPALARDGTVVVGSDDGGIYGLRAADGAQVFRVATAGPVRSSARIDGDGWMYVGSEDDRVYALDPHAAVAWSVSLGADVDSSAALPRDGFLVVGCDDGALYGLGR